MIVIPAVDIKNGKCVRLLQGRLNDDTVYSDDPAAMAAKWERLGAQIIHVIDLDGAISKSPRNVAVIREIAQSVQVPIQLGGGIRNEQTVAMYLEMGIRRFIIGTEAIRSPEFVKRICKSYPDQIIVGIDARNGKVAIDGWTQTTHVEAVDLARAFEDCGVAAINFTDIQRDGMQTGPNLEATKQLAEAISIPVVASGGVSSIQDIKDLLALEEFGVIGVIVGKALYSGELDLKVALEMAHRPFIADN
ncbi:MAG: 1-(5-phosphoribosyl)-5-[(5-phosphoribosylamino)methylideneamino]imidazole-4-carboxamide isomerase [Desulfobacterales bacterium]|jgi:phosphoribosylformimino-5-aminoimidazole carboxamide ribotide isomerase